jgi:hypothetical protein
MRKILKLIFITALVAACNSPTKELPVDQSIEPESTSKITKQSDTVTVKAQESEKNQFVYVTHEGEKYHTADCRYSKDAHTVTLKQAKSDGKTACDLCKPNSVTGDKQIRCSAKTADGTQCKRMTTNKNGKCFQHNKS